MIKQRQVNIGETNIANLGTELEKNVRLAASKYENQWKVSPHTTHHTQDDTPKSTHTSERERERYFQMHREKEDDNNHTTTTTNKIMTTTTTTTLTGSRKRTRASDLAY
jgi:hypothetical protein